MILTKAEYEETQKRYEIIRELSEILGVPQYQLVTTAAKLMRELALVHGRLEAFQDNRMKMKDKKE